MFSFLAPVIVAVLSPVFLQESSKGAWVAIAGCSIGVLLVAQPGVLFGSTRLSAFGVCLGILHSTASGTAKVLPSPLRRVSCSAFSYSQSEQAPQSGTSQDHKAFAADVCQGAEGGSHACEDAVSSHVQYRSIERSNALVALDAQDSHMAQLHDAARVRCALHVTGCPAHARPWAAPAQSSPVCACMQCCLLEV